MQIEIVGAIGGTVTMSAEDVLRVLDFSVKLGHGSMFQGKPSTRLYANNDFVLKRKSEYSLTFDIAIEWCERQLDKERRYGIYPPHRHWVVLQQADGARGCAVANVSMRGTTLEEALVDAGIAQDTQHIVWLFAGFLQTYFQCWRQHGLRQDEGLSNYIVEGGNIYYIDDDIYSTDNLISLAHALCTYLRQLLFLSETEVIGIAEILRQEINKTDKMLLNVFVNHMRHIFLAPNAALLREKLIDRMRARAAHVVVAMKEDRIAVLSDIHGNLPALEAVMAEMQAQGLQQALVLGDIVNYGPFPAECVELLREQPWLFVRGNHDHAAAEGQEARAFNRAAKWSLPWTLKKLDEKQRAWLGSLPLLWREGRYEAVHGAPVDPTFFNSYVYSMTASHNLDALQARDIHICFHGHSHLPGVYQRNAFGEDAFRRDDIVVLNKKSRYLVCPGSVGQPRDDSILAQYAIFDRRALRVEFKQVPYDREKLLAGLRALETPAFVMKQFGFAE